MFRPSLSRFTYMPLKEIAGILNKSISHVHRKCKKIIQEDRKQDVSNRS